MSPIRMDVIANYVESKNLREMEIQAIFGLSQMYLLKLRSLVATLDLSNLRYEFRDKDPASFDSQSRKFICLGLVDHMDNAEEADSVAFCRLLKFLYLQ